MLYTLLQVVIIIIMINAATDVPRGPQSRPPHLPPGSSPGQQRGKQ